jgi:hypothetical protein
MPLGNPRVAGVVIGELISFKFSKGSLVLFSFLLGRVIGSGLAAGCFRKT